MYAVFTVVEIDPAKWPDNAAVGMLKDQLIPHIKQAPGFVKGTWFGNDHSGHGLVLFDTEDQAARATQEIKSTVVDGIQVLRSDVYDFHAEA